MELMNEKKREKNETEYDFWLEKKNGNRIYSFEINGKSGWRAKYCKEVNSEEVTIRFWQEVYDEKNIIREIHDKYPVDKGHKKV